MSTRNDRDLDDLLGEDSGRVGALYRKLSRSDPPRRLDRNVIAEASRAVHGRPRGPRWLLGVGTAAGVLVAAGIAWRVNHDMDQQRGRQLETAPMSVPASPAAKANAPVPDVIHVEPRGMIDPAPAPAAKGEAVAPEAKARPLERNRSNELKPHAEIAVPSAPPPLRKTEQTKQKRDSDFVADPAEKESAASSDQDDAGLRERRDEHDQRPQAAAAPMRGSEAESSVAAQPRADQPSATTADSTRMAELIGAGRVEPKAAMTLDAVAAELERIRSLLGNGRRDEARAALQRLREQNPDLVLPDDLRELAR